MDDFRVKISFAQPLKYEALDKKIDFVQKPNFNLLFRDSWLMKHQNSSGKTLMVHKADFNWKHRLLLREKHKKVMWADDGGML